MGKCSVKQIRFHLFDEKERMVNEFLERKPHCISQLCTIALSEMIQKYNLEDASDSTIKDFIKFHSFIQNGNYTFGKTSEQTPTAQTTFLAKEPTELINRLRDELLPKENTEKSLITEEDKAKMNNILQDFYS